MSDFPHEDKLIWQLEQLPGVVSVGVQEEGPGEFRVAIEVRRGQLDDIWDEMVAQVEDLERILAGEAALDLDVRPL